MSHLDASVLASAIDGWERHRGPFDVPPYDTFRALHRLEARYLWLLSRRFAPPKDLVPSALRNLLAWGLIGEDASVTPLGRRLLATAKREPAPDPLASGVR